MSLKFQVTGAPLPSRRCARGAPLPDGFLAAGFGAAFLAGLAAAALFAGFLLVDLRFRSFIPLSVPIDCITRWANARYVNVGWIASSRAFAHHTQK